MSRFKGKGSQTYDQRITKLIPGYELLYNLTAAKLKLLLPEEANILVIGAGTGNEILNLSKVNDQWAFTALDPAKDMLDIAQSKFREEGIEQRVNFHHGTISSFENGHKFDAALCFFVMHFISNLSEKKELLSSIRSHLVSNGDLFIADLMKPISENDRLAQAQASHLLGLPEEKNKKILNRLSNDFFPLDRGELDSLLQEAGYPIINAYFQAIRFSAFHIIF
ncbi:class I SAM-dependent methyltransferase [Fodinibius sp. Rm-B-1B1-1]|uniref:class I SAM-dependent methyltransferase n=1 Tax=Fodinibius alkaliphilus TaxID=3140241 RepID=UPI00315B149D